MKRFIPVFMIVLLVLGWGCGGNGSTGGNGDKKDISVTIEIPPEWEQRKAEGNIILYDLVNNQGGFFFLTKDDAMGKNLEEHVEQKKSFYQKQYKDFELLGTKELSIDGRAALEITYTTNNTKNKDAYVKIGQDVFVFKLVSDEANFDDILDDYHWILESAKFK